LDKDPLSELEGRLAALELVLSLVLGAVGRTSYNSNWAPLSDLLLQMALRELRESLHGHGAVEAEATLRLIFERSIRDLQIENFRPDYQDSSAGIAQAKARY
jgi:hypothetical protein